MRCAYYRVLFCRRLRLGYYCCCRGVAGTEFWRGQGRGRGACVFACLSCVTADAGMGLDSRGDWGGGGQRICFSAFVRGVLVSFRLPWYVRTVYEVVVNVSIMFAGKCQRAVCIVWTHCHGKGGHFCF